MFRKPSYEELAERCRTLEAALAHQKGLEEEVSRLGSRLAESEKRFRLMTDFTDSWEYWIGPDARLRYVSRSCEKYTGYGQQELMADEGLFLDMVHPEDRARVVDHIRQELDNPDVESMMYRILDRGGRERWILHTCQPVYDDDGTFWGRRASNREVTAQRAAEIERDGLMESLKKTSNLLNTILDAIPDVIGLQELDHRIIRYNRAGYEFLGLAPEEAYGRKCYELIGRSMPCDACATSEVYRTGKVARVEKYVDAFDIWLDVRAYPVFDDTGNLVQVIEHLRDISTEKNAEIKLREAHERLITVLNSIDAHIYVADFETHEVIFVNRKMIDDFKSEFNGKKCYEAFRSEEAPCRHCTNHLLVDEARNPTGVYTWQCVNPLTQRWYINFDRAIKWVDGRLARIQIATDITEAKQHEKERLKMEQLLQQAQKFEAIGTLAGGIAHDFNNLLMGIQGRASLIAVDLPPSHPAKEHIDAIEDYIKSASNLTRQLLGFARGGKYEVLPIDINELLLESAAMFGRTKKEIRIHTRLEEPPPVVDADRRQIEQVLLNMYVNAWQAMPQGGKLSLGTRSVTLDEVGCAAHPVQPGRYVKISISDTGVGIEASALHRVFDPFFTTKEKGRGTGLGLASAYGIVKNHAGFITAHSEVGHGATFHIYLPLSGQKARREPASDGALFTGRETVLLVDDEEMIIDVGGAMLQKLGYRVIVARTGEKAVEAVAEMGAAVDLVLLDLVMPGMDGARAFDIIRRMQPQLPVILASGYSINGKAAEIMQRGCSGFIQKPFNIAELSRQVRKVLDKAP